MGNILPVLSGHLPNTSKISIYSQNSTTIAPSVCPHQEASNKEYTEFSLDGIIHMTEEIQACSKDSTGQERTVRFHSFTSCVEHRSENCKNGRVHGYRRAVSEMAVTRFSETNHAFFSDSDSNITTKDDKTLKDVASEFTFTCYEEVSIENEVKQSTFSRTVSQVGNTQEKSNSFTSRLRDLVRDKFNSSEDEDEGDIQPNKVKKHHKMTLVAIPDGTTQVNHSAKDIAKYCTHLLTAQFAGQTTWSFKTDCSSKTHRGPHLGDYLRLMDSYLRRFDRAEDFTGEEEYYLLILWYIATKRYLPKEKPEDCFERLKLDSKRFVKIYLERGGFSQPIITHQDFWGSRQQLLSGKVIADWVDPSNGPLDPVFGVLLQPTAGRAGPGDAGLFHQVMFDGNGPCAYHSAVHDAFGYLKTDHGVGPGYDYMHNSYFKSSRPVAGQIGGLKFWKKVLHSKDMKPHVMDLTTQTLGIIPIPAYL